VLDSFPAKRGKSLPRFIGHDVLILNAPVRRFDNDPDRTTAAAANLNVDMEYTFQSLNPSHASMALSR